MVKWLLLWIPLAELGCGGSSPSQPRQVVPTDSVRYVDYSGRTRPVAYVWPNGKINLFSYDTNVVTCTQSGASKVYSWDVADSCRIDFFSHPDTIRGKLAFARPDSLYPVLSSDFWAIMDPDSAHFHGLLRVTLNGPCYVRTDSQYFDLVRAQ